MTRRLFNTPDFIGVASPGTAVVQLPVGDFAYEQINLIYTESASLVSVANMKTAITKVQLLADNVPIHEYSATELLAINESLGRGAGQAGHLPLPITFFGLPDFATMVAERIGTADISSLSIKVTIASGRTAPALAAVAMGVPLAAPIGNILQWEPLTITPGASNAFHRLNNQEDFGRPILGLWAATTAMTRFRYKVGQTAIIDDITIAELDRIYAMHPVLAPVSGFSIINFAMTGNIADAQPVKVGNTPLINQTAELFMTSTSAFNAVVGLVGAPRR